MFADTNAVPVMNGRELPAPEKVSQLLEDRQRLMDQVREIDAMMDGIGNLVRKWAEIRQAER